MAGDIADEVLAEWERQRGDEFRAHFEVGHRYLHDTVCELAAADAEPDPERRLAGYHYLGRRRLVPVSDPLLRRVAGVEVADFAAQFRADSRHTAVG